MSASINDKDHETISPDEFVKLCLESGKSALEDPSKSADLACTLSRLSIKGPYHPMLDSIQNSTFDIIEGLFYDGYTPKDAWNSIIKVANDYKAGKYYDSSWALTVNYTHKSQKHGVSGMIVASSSKVEAISSEPGIKNSLEQILKKINPNQTDECLLVCRKASWRVRATRGGCQQR